MTEEEIGLFLYIACMVVVGVFSALLILSEVLTYV